jgi:hypothetical protein
MLIRKCQVKKWISLDLYNLGIKLKSFLYKLNRNLNKQNKFKNQSNSKNLDHM